jgi:ubiquitin-like 1-activating enzyme E1 B
LKPTVRGKIVINDAAVKPNPKCYVCTNKREVFVKLNTLKMTQKTFTNTLIKEGIGMIAPDVSDFGSGRIVVSSEESDNKGLSLRCNYSITIFTFSH